MCVEKAFELLYETDYSQIPTSILPPTPPKTLPPPATSSPITSEPNHKANISFISTIAGMFGVLSLVLLLVIACIFIQRRKRHHNFPSFKNKNKRKSPLKARKLDISGPINLPNSSELSTSISEESSVVTTPPYEPTYKTHYVIPPSSPSSSISSPHSLGYGPTPTLTPRSPKYSTSSTLTSSSPSSPSFTLPNTTNSPRFPNSTPRNPAPHPLPLRMETTSSPSSMPRRPHRPPPL